jgi:glutathione S-transferase
MVESFEEDSNVSDSGQVAFLRDAAAASDGVRPRVGQRRARCGGLREAAALKPRASIGSHPRDRLARAADPSMITVHHLNNSRSQRVLWLLEELGLPYDIKHYQRNAATNLAPPELLQVHPLGKSPVITDGDVTVAETGAIIEYLVDRAGSQLRPSAGTVEHRRYTYWLHFAEGSAMPPLVMTLVLGRIKKSGPFFVKPIARRIADGVLQSFVMPNIKRQLTFMEAELATRPWFAGDEFSAADVQMSFPLEVAAVRGGLGAQYPRLGDFLARIHARPTYQAALKRGGPYGILR